MAEQLVVIELSEDAKVRRGCCRYVTLKKGKHLVTKEEAQVLVNAGLASFVLGSAYGVTNSESEVYTPIEPQCGYWHPILWTYEDTQTSKPDPLYKDDRDPVSGHTQPVEWEWRPRDCNLTTPLPTGHNGQCGVWEPVDGNGLSGHFVHSMRFCDDGYWFDHPLHGLVWIPVPGDERSDTNCGTHVAVDNGKFPKYKHPRRDLGAHWMPFPCAELLG